ncbi:MAG TPA: LacI family DNA-binding transcriptional regulator [Terriglobia bacterium]|nr:LacI family DNA-binding transcriptional regulator [Terriglobia bacterium]
MATLKEVARRANVSVGTVSNVLNRTARVSESVRVRVTTAIRELEYHPNHVARSLKLKATKMLGMIVSDITNPFFSQMVRGAEDAALKRNYLLLTFNTDDHFEREKKVLSVLRSRRVDGVLLVVAPSDERPEHIADTIGSGLPVVCLDRLPPGMKVDSVTVDNVAGTQECIRHLIARGHRRIGIITGSLFLETARQRLQGYKNALEDAGIKIEQELICEGNFREQTGYQLGRKLLLQTDRPSALFTSNSLMAIGTLRAIEELELQCPKDIAIATFDDLPLTEVFHPHLTAVAQPAFSIGYAGAELLIQRIETKGASESPVAIRLPTQLKVRESTMGFLRSKTMEVTQNTFDR